MLGYSLKEHPKSTDVEPGVVEPRLPPDVDAVSPQPMVPVFLLGEDQAMEADFCEHLWCQPGFDLVATHYEAQSAMRIVDALSPEIVVVHIGSDDIDRLAFIEACRSRYPDRLIFVAFSKAGPSLRKSAFAAGASGELSDIEDATLCHYFLTQAAEYIRLRAVNVEPGRHRMPILHVDCAEAQARSLACSATIDLTRIEIEIGRALAMGKSVSEIALTLGLSPKQVAIYRGRIRDSLCCRTNLEANALLATHLRS